MARVTAGGNTVYVENLADAFLPQNGDVEILMLADARLDETVEVTGGNYTLDLNGQTIRSGIVRDYTGVKLNCVLLVENAGLAVQDSGGSGCILSDEEKEPVDCISVADTGRLTFSGGKIQEFYAGLVMSGGSSAEVTGNAFIQNCEHGIWMSGGWLIVSGEARIWGKHCGIWSIGYPQLVKQVMISGNPNIGGESTGIYHLEYQDSYLFLAEVRFGEKKLSRQAGLWVLLLSI